jgi:hypothetical protein
LNYVVALIESKKAELVVIALDVDPVELFVFLPALCRKMGVPYVIVKGKARLGTVVHKKTAAVLAIQEVKSEDQRELATLVSANLYVFWFLWCVEHQGLILYCSSDKYDEQRRQWWRDPWQQVDGYAPQACQGCGTEPYGRSPRQAVIVFTFIIVGDRDVGALSLRCVDGLDVFVLAVVTYVMLIGFYDDSTVCRLSMVYRYVSLYH